ncbi:flagellar protein FlgN [Cohnella thailandensis]|uniref:Flagellar protein FlgN n=1 Tax=Cohnella thailandensis TaxID=557557 RepID=A0A841SL11_9BACL|nr:flagellar protein FlgN [Cohnella thailandensis]MBB6632594.1 flagellar protein FlgN [Cohnella thailandensis]MBP1971888.1 flagellar biosynthesis/type III secretory pathway chaperone [Cohnella thailandensis]
MAIKELFRTMELLQEQHEALIELGEQKREAVVRNEVSRLPELTTKESRLLRLVQEAEQARQKAVAQYCVSKGVAANPGMSMSSLVRLETNVGDKVRLEELGNRLVETVSRLSALNEQNLELLRQAVDFNEFTIGLLTGSEDQDVVYKPPANYNGYGAGARMFDSRA